MINKPQQGLASRGYTACKAYTLIELLIVLVIIGVMLSITALTFSSVQSPPVKETLSRLRLDVGLAVNESIVRSEILAIGFAESAYAFYRLDEDGEFWELIEQDDMLKARKLKPDLTLALYLDERKVVLPPALETGQLAEPQVTVYPTGEVTPFVCEVQYKDEAPQQLRFNAIGRVVSDEDEKDGSL